MATLRISNPLIAKTSVHFPSSAYGTSFCVVCQHGILVKVLIVSLFIFQEAIHAAIATAATAATERVLPATSYSRVGGNA